MYFPLVLVVYTGLITKWNRTLLFKCLLCLTRHHHSSGHRQSTCFSRLSLCATSCLVSPPSQSLTLNCITYYMCHSVLPRMRSDLFKHCCAVLSLFSHVWLCVTLCTAAHNRLLCPCGFFRQEYWSGLPCPALGDSQPRDQTCVSCIAGRFFTAELPGRPPSQDAALCLVA